MMITHSMGTPFWLVSDMDVIQEFATTKNDKIDKLGSDEVMLREFLGKSFLFSKGDEVWKAKRKACAHAFYKDKLDAMLEVLKGQTNRRLSIWLKEMEQSADGSANIDINYEFERLFSRNIVEISFGEDVSDNRFDFLKVKEGTFDELYTKKVSIREAISTLNDMMIPVFTSRMKSPYNFYVMMSQKGVMTSSTKLEKAFTENCKRIRDYVNAYVQDRKQGKNSSKL